MPCNAMHPIQDLFLEGFSYVLQIDMHFICTPMWMKFYSCEKWVLQSSSPRKSLWAPYVSRHMTKPPKTSSGTRKSTSSMKEDGNRLLKMHGTTRHSNTTKSSSRAAESSRWTIWHSGGCSLKKELTSSPPARRTPSA
jgi:hypothetical protein